MPDSIVRTVQCAYCLRHSVNVTDEAALDEHGNRVEREVERTKCSTAGCVAQRLKRRTELGGSMTPRGLKDSVELSLAMSLGVTAAVVTVGSYLPRTAGGQTPRHARDTRRRETAGNGEHWSARNGQVSGRFHTSGQVREMAAGESRLQADSPSHGL
jgi:hypothetical protein